MFALLQLLRLPNVFTALADILMGYLLVHQSLSPWPVCSLLAVSSAMLYLSGMVLNDVFDVEQDRRERPGRPLPSGRISIRAATRIGGGLLGAGVALSWLVGIPVVGGEAWRSGVVGTLLAICIVLYDGLLKSRWAGPWLMGACRSGNVLLGMSTGSLAIGRPPLWLGFDSSQLVIAGAIGLYVVGVTYFARHEAQQGDRPRLGRGVVLMTTGLVLLGLFPRTGAFASGDVNLTLRPAAMWPLLVALLGFSVLRRCVIAIQQPTAERIQVAVKQCLVSLIVFDAAICLATVRPWYWSVLILALMFPMLVLGRWVYST